MTSWRLPALQVLSAYVRHAPPHPGQWRMARLAVQWSPLLKTAPRPRVVRVRDGFRLLVDGTSQTGRIAYATGRYEPRTTQIIQARVQPGDVVVDVGANIGYFSIVAARAAGPSGRVVAFEPVESVRRQLARNLQLNDLEHVEIRSEALSDRTADATFYQGPDRDTGLGSLRPLEQGHQVTVHQVRFDDIWDPSRRVSLVKIDVEGAELRVLQGMADCLTRDRPDIIVEVTDQFLRALGASASDLLGFLTACGYRMYQIPDEGPLAEITTSAALAQAGFQFNALCSTKAIGWAA